MKTGLYVGSFDPITLGHLDIVSQALEVFDKVYIAVGINPTKKDTARFSIETRLSLIEQSVREIGLDSSQINVLCYTGSMMQAARDTNATAIVRGLRQMSDFNDEFLINGMVAKTLPGVPITYFICKQEYLHVSSSAVKQLTDLDEEYSWMVTDCVMKELHATRKN
jgi:pantetheine-phosphate adenylyltransferase